MKRNRSFISLFIVCQLLLDGSCTKFVSVDLPNTQLVTSTVFSSDQTAISAMNGVYSSMLTLGGFAAGGSQSVGFLSGLSADELINYSVSSEQIQFFQNSLDKSNSLLYIYLWQTPYQIIYQVNAILEGVNASIQMSENTKRELIGEAEFIRAFCNFYLTNLFGDIPLILSTQYSINALMSRDKKGNVFQQMVSDLKDAETKLAVDYSYSNGEKVRPNAWAASALLARVYLFMEDWQNAEAESTNVINQNSLFSLCSDLSQVFLANSTEAIWQLESNMPEINTLDGNTYILTSAPLDAALSPSLVQAFEPGDARFTNWVSDTMIDLITYYYPFKYKIKNGSTLTEYFMVLRLAELYLIRAEARVNLNNPSGAASDLNALRNRAGLSNTTAFSPADLLSAIGHERQVELFTEWGQRWMDLIRTGRVTLVLGSLKSNWQPSDTLYPIPQGEIQKDPNLTQNAGY